jgi:tetratricopeptide (TPR) repeat protein
MSDNKLLHRLEKVLTNLLANNNSSTGSIDFDLDILYHQIGRLKKDQGKYLEADENCRKSLQIKLAKFSQDSQDSQYLLGLCDLLYDIGWIHGRNNCYDKAFLALKICGQIRLRHFSTDSIGLANVYRSIGRMYYAQGKLNEAEKYFQENLITLLKSSEPYQEKIALYWCDLGDLYLLRKDYVKANNFYKDSKQILLNLYQKEHWNVGLCLNQFGRISIKMGELDKALDYLNSSLQIIEKNYSAESYEVAHCYYFLGDAYESKNPKKSLEYHMKSLNIKLKSYFACNTDIAHSLIAIGKVCLGLKDLEEGKEFLEYGLKILSEIFQEEENVYITMAYDGLLSYEMLTNNPGKATEYFKKKGTNNQQTCSKSNPSVDTTDIVPFQSEKFLFKALEALGKLLGEYNKYQISNEVLKKLTGMRANLNKFLDKVQE